MAHSSRCKEKDARRHPERMAASREEGGAFHGEGSMVAKELGFLLLLRILVFSLYSFFHFHFPFPSFFFLFFLVLVLVLVFLLLFFLLLLVHSFDLKLLPGYSLAMKSLHSLTSSSPAYDSGQPVISSSPGTARVPIIVESEGKLQPNYPTLTFHQLTTRPPPVSTV